MKHILMTGIDFGLGGARAASVCAVSANKDTAALVAWTPMKVSAKQGPTSARQYPSIYLSTTVVATRQAIDAGSAGNDFARDPNIAMGFDTTAAILAGPKGKKRHSVAFAYRFDLPGIVSILSVLCHG